MRIERPMVNPGLRRVWRDTRTLQFGVDVTHPVVVHDVDAATAELLRCLDGTLTRAEVDQRAHALHLDLGRIASLMTQLAAQRVIVDGASWPGSRHLSRTARDRLITDHHAQCLLRGTHDAVRRREKLAEAEVTVHGVGRLGSVICSLLTASGVGRVVPVDEHLVSPTDTCVAGFPRSSLGQPRRLIAEQAAAWSCSNEAESPRKMTRWSVVTNACASRTVAASLFHQGRPHLVTAAAEQWARIGPLVLPGVTSCLRCFDLIQGDRDPSWPTVAAQLDPVPPAIAGDSNLVTATAAVAVMHLLEAIDQRRPASANGVAYLQMPDGAMLHRLAPSSPQCGCTWPGGQPRLAQRQDQSDDANVQTARTMVG